MSHMHSITSGNAAAGAGSAGMTMLSEGSAAVMERTDLGAMHSITSGNAAAGSGSAGMTMVSAGSAGTMDR